MADNNKVHYDLVDVHVAPLTIAAGVATFGKPQALEGSISMDLSTQGNHKKLRADGNMYWQGYGNDGYEGNMNLALVPDWFRKEYLGEVLDEGAKVQIENAEAQHKPFALIYGFKGDACRRRHVLYNCMSSRANIKGENKESGMDPDTEALTITAIPLPNGDVKASTTADTPKAVFDSWLTEVWQRGAEE